MMNLIGKLFTLLPITSDGMVMIFAPDSRQIHYTLSMVST